MNASRIAVWLLELVTTPERAATTVGDFMEESSERGRFWFWSQVAGTFLSSVGREFTSAPFRLLLCLPMALLFYIVFGRIYGPLVMWTTQIWAHFYFKGYKTQFFPGPSSLVLALVVFTIVHVVGGWALAQTTKRPLAASLAFAIGCAVWWSAVTVEGVRQVHLLPSYGVPQALVLIGAIWQRRRSLRIA